MARIAGRAQAAQPSNVVIVPGFEATPYERGTDRRELAKAAQRPRPVRREAGAAQRRHRTIRQADYADPRHAEPGKGPEVRVSARVRAVRVPIAVLIVLAVFFAVWPLCEIFAHLDRETALALAALGDAIVLIPLSVWVGSPTEKPTHPGVPGPKLRFSERMDTVERKCANKLYYHDDGWARAIRLWGAEAETLPVGRLKISYTHEPFRVPPEFQEERDRTVHQRAEDARENGRMYFDGPNTRLLKWRISPADGDDVGREDKILELALGPIGWYDYEGLNGSFESHPEQRWTTEFLDSYVGLPHLLADGRVEASRFANILDNAIAIVTNDGYVGYSRRGGRVSLAPGSLTSAVAENTNRFLDDADPGDPTRRHNLPADRSMASTDYVPRGVPHPVAAVLRGIGEEISQTVRQDVNLAGVYVTGVAFNLEAVHPTLLFAVFVNLSRDEVLEKARSDPGRDHNIEISELLFIPADHTHPETRSVLSSGNWVPSGLAATIRALEILRFSDGDTVSVIRSLINGGAALGGPKARVPAS